MASLEHDIAKLIRQYRAKTGKLLTIGSIESATGGRKLLNVDICISDTGIAGPTGATSGKPVGLFYLSLSSRDTCLSRKHKFKGNREENKQNATKTALTILKRYLQTCLDRLNSKSTDGKHVVTCFLAHKGKILILRRSKKVGSYQGKWAGVSGYIEARDIEQAYTEIKEETSLNKSDVELKVKGEPLQVIDQKLRWIVHPFLFRIKKPAKIKTDWEHTETTWIQPEELTKYETVPGLKDALDRVIYKRGK